MKVGVSVQDITPAVGAQLYGYRPDVFSKSVNDALTATAVALVTGETQALLISVAVCSIQTQMADRIRQEIEKETGVKAEHILLSAFHNHSGPNTTGGFGWGELDRDYCETVFIPHMIAAAKEAVSCVRPALTGVAAGWSRAGINRRQYDADGIIRLGQNPWWAYDGNMTVISFRDADGKTIANLVHYGNHGTAAGVNTEISRDWAGVMVDALSRESGAPTAYLQGAEGDTGPRLSNGCTTGDIASIYEIGGIAAVDAVQAWRSIKQYADIPLEVKQGQITLPRRDAISLEEAERGCEAYGDAAVNLNGHMANYYKAVVKAYKDDQPKEEPLVLQQTMLCLGDIVMVPFPFEIFSEISLRLRKYSPYTYTLCLGLTNGNEGYLPTQSQLCLGGYEVLYFETSGVWPLAPDTDTTIIQENLRIMEG